MLSPDERSLYTEALEAPLGYRFDCAVATTFTLNLETLLVLPFTLVSQREADRDALLRDPTALLEALRETTERIAVFGQKGYVHVPPREQLLYGMLEDCVHPVVARHEAGIFHPKLWLLRFASLDEGPPVLRAVVLSRNLTFDRCWDTVLSVEGTPTGKKVKASFGLRDFLRALPELTRLAGATVGPERQAFIEQLADEAGRTLFEAPAPFVDRVVFNPIGIAEEPKRRGFSMQMPSVGKRLLCVSPFVTKGALDAASDLVWEGSEHILVSREDELNKLPEKALEGWKVFILGDNVETGESSDEGVEVESDDLARIAPANGLHAKMVAVEYDKGDVRWSIGSANLTTSAWEGRNVELMAELDGKTTIRKGFHVGAGIDALLKETTEKSGLEPLLIPYVRSDRDPDVVAHEKALELADDVRLQLTRAELELVHEGEGDAWDLAIRGRATLPASVKAWAWPVTLAEGTHRADVAPLAAGAPVAWTGLAMVSLTSIIAFGLTATHEGASATVRFAMKLPHAPFPGDRHARILQHIIRTRDGFFRYLRLLLAAANGEPLWIAGNDGARGSSASDALSFLSGESILEDILRAVTRDPSRLDAIDRLLTDLCATDEGRALVPAEFRETWDTIRAATQPEGKPA